MQFVPACAWQRLGDYLKETRLLGSIQNTLYWDQNTTMPPQGAAWRGEQLELLARYLHARQSSSRLEDLIAEAKREFIEASKTGKFSPTEIQERSRNLELLEKDFSRQKHLDPDLVGRLAIAKTNGYALWQEARKKSHFSTFAPALRLLISLRQEQAKQLNEPMSCWEALAQPFEPDLSKIRLNQLFLPLKQTLPTLLEKVKGRNSKKTNWDLTSDSQQKLCDQLLFEWGRDLNLTALSKSPHPFSITLGPKDFRMTTRVVRGQPLSCFFATAHEWGHSLYEQGLPPQSHQWFAWPLGQATSMAIHESQSLFWENRVARSLAFAERFWPQFVMAGAPFKSAFDLWRFMNPFTPGLNRIEADELSYGLHIIVRTELEIALLEEDLEVNALPEEWNRRYKDLLGVAPANDLEGCLQDVHWSEGQFGYFPSYLLGHLVSAQLSEKMNSDLRIESKRTDSPIDDLIRSGQESHLLTWLRDKVHIHGRKMNSEQLVEKITGSTLTSLPFLNYLEQKIEIFNDTLVR